MNWDAPEGTDDLRYAGDQEAVGLPSATSSCTSPGVESKDLSSFSDYRRKQICMPLEHPSSLGMTPVICVVIAPLS